MRLNKSFELFYLTFLYGSENLTPTALQRRRIEAAEMKLLRPLAGYILNDHKTNDYIHRELRITGILNMIDEYRRNWLSHLQRMPQNRIPLKSYRYRPQGRRTIGRPKKRWREQLKLWRRNGSKGPILDVYGDDDWVVFDGVLFIFITTQTAVRLLLFCTMTNKCTQLFHKL